MGQWLMQIRLERASERAADGTENAIRHFPMERTLEETPDRSSVPKGPVLYEVEQQLDPTFVQGVRYHSTERVELSCRPQSRAMEQLLPAFRDILSQRGWRADEESTIQLECRGVGAQVDGVSSHVVVMTRVSSTSTSTSTSKEQSVFCVSRVRITSY